MTENEQTVHNKLFKEKCVCVSAGEVDPPPQHVDAERVQISDGSLLAWDSSSMIECLHNVLFGDTQKFWVSWLERSIWRRRTEDDWKKAIPNAGHFPQRTPTSFVETRVPVLCL
jgi:hypothetical protein